MMSGEDQDRNVSIADAIKFAAKLRKSGDIEAADNYVSSCLEEHPDSAALHAYLAASLSLMGHLDEALVHAERAVLLAPKVEKWSIVLTRTLWKAGRHDGAFEEMKRFLKIRPSKVYSEMIKEWKCCEADEHGHAER